MRVQATSLLPHSYLILKTNITVCLFVSHFILAFNLYAYVNDSSLTFSETGIMETTQKNTQVYTEKLIIACLKTYW